MKYLKVIVITFSLLGFFNYIQCHKELEKDGQNIEKEQEALNLEQKPKKQNEKLNFRQNLQLQWEKHSPEISVTVVLVIYAINFFLGRKINQNIAQNWLTSVKNVLSDNFSTNGENQSIEHPDDLYFEQSNNTEYEMLLSGRENIHYAHITLFLKSRHELMNKITSIIRRLFKAEKDIFQIEIPIDRPDKCIHSEMLIISKRQIEDVYYNMPHLAKIMRNYNPSTLDLSQDFPLQISGENSESIDELFSDTRIQEIIQRHKKEIQVIHVTDQKLYTKYEFVLKAQFLISQDQEKNKRIMKDILYIADYLSKMKVRAKLQEETLVRRRKLQKNLFKN